MEALVLAVVIVLGAAHRNPRLAPLGGKLIGVVHVDVMITDYTFVSLESITYRR